MNLYLGLKFEGRQENGRLIINDVYRFRRNIVLFKERVLEVIIRIKYPESSDRQRRYYRKVVVGMIAECTGQDTDLIHAILKRKFLTVKIEITPGICEEYTRSTKELNTVEMNEYMKQCRDWAFETLRDSKGNGFYIPEPEKVEA